MRAHGPRLLLDLSAVSFMDCAGLRALVLTLRHAELCGWPMHLIAASAMVRKKRSTAWSNDRQPPPGDLPAFCSTIVNQFARARSRA
jgi:hypothetical protein